MSSDQPDSDSSLDFERPLHVGFFGATLDTGNLGVSVLALSMIQGLLRTGAKWTFTLFDERPGTRRRVIIGSDWEIEARCVGCYISRRYYSPNNLQQCHLASRLGLGGLHPTLRVFRDVDAIMDISGGDSFCDMYGVARFRSQIYPKLIALAQGTPLFLLPQTYGPFSTPEHLAIAREIVLRSDQAWTRDPRGLEVLMEILGDDFDAQRQRSCVDVGFGLAPREPEDEALRAKFLELRERAPLLLGVNVSGLLYNDPSASQRVFGFKDPYREIMHTLVVRLLAHPDAQVALFSHVCPEGGAPRMDAAACLTLRDELSRRLRKADLERVTVVPHVHDPAQTWWMIGRCDWFSGARMHSCIGALSQGVPTAAMAYSRKTLGVVETAGAGEWVLDPRNERSQDMAERAFSSIEKRTEMSSAIEHAMVAVRRTLDVQFDEIAHGIAASVSAGRTL